MTSIESGFGQGPGLGQALGWGDPAMLWATRLPPAPALGVEVAAPSSPVVHIVDPGDDARLLSGWLRSIGLGACRHAGLDAFLHGLPPSAPGCLVIDAAALAQAGDLAEVMRRLAGRWPVVMTAEGADVTTAVQAMKTGAVDFVEKPFRQADILQAVETALSLAEARRLDAARAESLARRFAGLTRRERQVMALVTRGLLNKQAAGELGLSEITVKAHRGAVMRKMAARTLPDLVRMADAIAAAVGGGHP